jgi:hypothetical protein
MVRLASLQCHNRVQVFHHLLILALVFLVWQDQMHRYCCLDLILPLHHRWKQQCSVQLLDLRNQRYLVRHHQPPVSNHALAWRTYLRRVRLRLLHHKFHSIVNHHVGHQHLLKLQHCKQVAPVRHCVASCVDLGQGDNMPLPRRDAPLRLADGRLVYPDGRVDHVDGPVDGLVEVPTHAEAQRIVTAARRKLSELPEVPRTMNAVSVVLAYSLFGLDDEEIAIATGLSVEQIGRIKVGDPYTQMHDAVVRTVLDSETNVVRELFVKNARAAAHVVVRAMEEGTRSDRMAAAKDVLDRSGHRPSDVVEHRHRMDGGLVIEIVKRDGAQMPVIDMESE